MIEVYWCTNCNEYLAEKHVDTRNQVCNTCDNKVLRMIESDIVADALNFLRQISHNTYDPAKDTY